MKTENLTSDGIYIGISPKCYCLYSNADKRFLKKRAKGIPRVNDLSVSDFKQAAHDWSYSTTVPVSRFEFNKKESTMNSVSRQQKAMNASYTKMQVQSDGITVKPLSLNGEYL